MKQQIQMNKIEWEEVELAELKNIISRGKSPKYVSNSKLKIINQKCIYWNGLKVENIKYWNEKEYPSKDFILKKGDILINSTGTGTLGRAAVFNEEGIYTIDTHVTLFRPNDKLNPKYFTFYLNTDLGQKELYQKCVSGSTNQIELSKSRFEKLKIILPFSNGKPDLKEQERIVKILEKAEKQKDKSKRSEELLNEYIKSVFNEMFYNKEFEKKYLSNFIIDFIVPQRDKPKVFDGNIPWCRIEDFDGVYLSDSKSGKYVSKETINDMNLKVYPIGTVIVSCSADLGKCAIIKKPLVTNQTFIGLVPSDRINSLFLYYYMKSKSDILNKMATGATIKYLSKKNFEKLNVEIPPIHIQQKFSSIVEQVEKMKEKLKISKKNSEDLFDSLIQKAFRGVL